MNIRESNYWLETLPQRVEGSTAPLPETTDVAVVGSGFCGLSAARVLAKRGARVVVLEAETIGWGASCRNGGMVLTGLKLPVTTLLARYGREITRQMYAAALESIALVEQIVGEESIDCTFSRCGHLEVACKPSHFSSYAASAERIRSEFHHELRVIPKSELRREIGSDIYYGGLVDESSAGLNPAQYVMGLAQAACRWGACLYEHTRVNNITPEIAHARRQFRISTSRGSLLAREVLLATGAYTTSATPALRKKVIPIGSYIIATEILPVDLVRELSPRNRMIYDSKHFLHYYRLTPDNRMLFGGRAAFFPESERTVRQSAEVLRRGMIQVYPQLRNTKVEFAWGGTLDFAFDVMPHAGAIEGMHFAVGFAGHGVAAATWMGAQLAGVICGDANDHPFSRIRFPAAPFGLRSGRTWALPLAGMYYRLLDFFT
ncbi:MAG TPA: FAD-binding oxidoreductase [Candidatus Eremiobacteraceae bacterium]|nr:FAD-binding oxidoreductase [Candidatus Eremiobacteraceae bacterium]